MTSSIKIFLFEDTYLHFLVSSMNTYYEIQIVMDRIGDVCVCLLGDPLLLVIFKRLLFYLLLGSFVVK